MIMPNGADNNEHNINSTMIDLMDISLSQSAPETIRFKFT